MPDAAVIDAVTSLLQSACAPEALALTGSLARGRGRPDSDLDLFVFVADHSALVLPGARRLYRDDAVTVLETSIAGREVQLCAFSSSWLEAVQASPWKAWNLLQARVLADPSGRLAACRRALAAWYAAHPAAEEEWRRQEAALDACEGATHAERARLRRERLEFPTPMAFAAHLDRLFGSPRHG